MKFKKYKDKYEKDRDIEFCLHKDGTLSILDDSRRDEDENIATWGVITKRQVNLLIKFLKTANKVKTK